MPRFDIDISNRQTLLAVDELRLRDAIERVLTGEQVRFATINLALVEDSEIHRVNREFLGHDHPTDVISFRLDEAGSQQSLAEDQKSEVGGQKSGVGNRESSGASSDSSLFPPPSTSNPQPHLEGELIVSTETALREAAAHGWSPRDEVLLYVVHGVLHLCGYDDLTVKVLLPRPDTFVPLM